MTRNSIRLLFITLLSLLTLNLSAQIKLQGKVTEKGSDEVVPFAHVFLKGTQIGTTTNMEGIFDLRVKSSSLPSDTLVVSSLGYITQSILLRGQSYIEIDLEPELRMMEDIVVKAGENPAYAVMDRIIKNKDQNNADKLDNYSCEEYSKIRFDLNHLTEKVKNNFFLKPFDYIWNNTDTTSDGVSYLTVLLVEKNSSHYYRRTPPKRKSIVEGKKVTGLPGPKILEFVEELYFTPNVYDNYIVILEKNFPSPLNNNYKLHYEYYLDSAGSGDNKTYNLQFEPKLERDLAFRGEMTIDSGSYAVQEISLRFDIMANVNFVRSYLVEQKYEAVDGEHWMLAESRVLGDYTVVENSSDLTGFFGRKHATYRNYQINDVPYLEAYNGIELVTETDSAELRGESYWQAIPDRQLDEKEEGVTQMVDQLETDPAFIFRKNLVMGFVSGYVPWKSWEIGDFYTFYSNNYVEDSRVKFGFRSDPDLAFPLSGSVYGAYGFKDEKWKYGLQLGYRLDTQNKNRIGASYRYDIMQLGRSINALPIDHILTSIVQIGSNESRLYEEEITGHYERELTTGLVTRLSYFRSEVAPTGDIQFEETVAGVVDNYTASGLTWTLKFNWQNKDLKGDFYHRDDFKKEFRRFPDLAIEYQYSGKSFGADVPFQKSRAYLRQHLRTKKLGYFQYHIEAGKTWGEVPYPYLNTPYSNQLVLYDDMAFNLMHYLEFITDQYFTVNVQQHFDGFIMDRIPLVNRLKWRSFVFAKGYWGELSQQNIDSPYLMPTGTVAMTEPYYEVGFGLENIFKIARMDFVWRLNDTTLPDSYTFIVKPSFRFSF
ncbi:DUF5686 and carboxypeptidase-like regulatory domain-containing protein [Reichenbachiella ulvae]|uniref:DUF5686 and carboxypeptidase regulatory-like domain-containing protein n=1 Tax=Reichenbachiella ulvae TaxID=2980104 RepID=A0ABT3CW48_9BACT|nr:DUF5686 and carboxypeptidase-like regulatory domain-containing protein [Reichenbachiella ulvae]MCV9387832.1 DUF5686 and carboxypeptidase regulatory-like domain-containing protein [Reichenbachiella ulvae]